MKRRKKNYFVMIVIVMMISLTACGSTKPEYERSDEPAIVSVTSSTGQKETFVTTNYVTQAEEEALWIVDEESTVINVYFNCPKCEYEEIWTANVAEYSKKLFHCNCTGNNEAYGQKEYFMISTAVGESFFGTLEQPEKPQE